MREKQRKDQKGFTLLELLVTVGISTMITYVLFMAMRSGDAQVKTADLKMTIQDSAREGLYKMVQEIRQSSPTRVDIAANTFSVQFNIPDPNNAVMADYTVNWTNSKRIQYALGGTNNLQIIRTDAAAGTTKVIANDVTSLVFTGNAADPTLVTITMGVQRTLINNRTVPATPLTLAAQAEIRNSG